MAKGKILIVEDEGIVSLDLEQQLAELGYEVAAVAVSGEEAINKAIETRPDLVLMDIRLKGDMDGVEAVERLQAHFDVPVVYLTAYPDWVTLQRVKATDPFAYLLKPVADDDLSHILDAALHEYHTISNS